MFREARLDGEPEVAVTTERLDDAPATGTLAELQIRTSPSPKTQSTGTRQKREGADRQMESSMHSIP